MSLKNQLIGNVAKSLGVSQHTLRYYERIGLLAPISKDSAGRRNYSNSDIERLRFIKRAQRMHFSLKEIQTLIHLDRSELIEKPRVRALVSEKLAEIDESLKDLKTLKKELQSMLNACTSSLDSEECPIIEGIKSQK